MKFLFFVLYTVSIVGLLYAVAALFLRKSGAPSRLPPPRSVGAFAGFLFLVTAILDACIVVIKPTDVGVLETPNGIQDEELYTGWHFISPLNKVHPMDKTIWVYSTVHDTKDGRDVSDAIWAACSDRIKMKLTCPPTGASTRQRQTSFT